jgi:glycosyltransferase involved in cell wall biosynthesis
MQRVDRRGGVPFFMARLIRAIAAGRPDVLHCWLVSAALWGRMAGRLVRVPDIVLSFRSSVIDEVPALRVARRFDGRSVRYLANNTSVADSLVCRVGVPRSRITVIFNGLDVEDYAAAGDRAGLLRSIGCPADARIVLTVGRLTVAKNFGMLMRVAQRFRESELIHFLIVGHGELEADLKSEAARLGVTDRVHFLGLRRDVPALMAAADVFCYTSTFEGFPNALLEAMAASRPIVTTRFTGVEQVVEDGTSALVVPQDDDAAAFAAVRRLLANPAESASLGAAARRRAETSFSTARMVESTLAYYEGRAGRG